VPAVIAALASGKSFASKEVSVESGPALSSGQAEGPGASKLPASCLEQLSAAW
jgi:hypothetical protein